MWLVELKCLPIETDITLPMAEKFFLEYATGRLREIEAICNKPHGYARWEEAHMDRLSPPCRPTCLGITGVFWGGPPTT